MADTTIKVKTTTRDKLAALAAATGSTLDEALQTLIWEHECDQALRRLDADPAMLAEYRAEAGAIAEATVADGLNGEPAW
jgi:hypothetical protein